MALELGHKCTGVADEFSSAEFLFAKDHAGPVFISKETERSFILTAHLKGYKKQNIRIEINEDASRIIIRGEMAIQETEMVGWDPVIGQKKTEMRRFVKAFKIPDGVILDKIKAKFNEYESIMTISMLKKEKGILGLSIEEEKEEHVHAREGSENLLQIVPDEVHKEENMLEEEHKETDAEAAEETSFKDEKSSKMPEIASVEEPKEAGLNATHPEETQVTNMMEQEKKENELDYSEMMQKVSDDHAHVTEKIEETKPLPDAVAESSTAKSPIHEGDIATNEIPPVGSGMRRQELEKQEISPGIPEKMEEEVDHQPTPMKPEKDPEEAKEGLPSRTEEKGRYKLYTPILAGSALLLSLVVFVIHVIRSKNQPGKRKDQ
ncbi:hypothetical protein ACH5RR_034327 [Cinchona calisaya]|uniref:SHSP domain-containing protein n=1 Tax=Cinchona calisaya TaxID=153742 RepID=A0ABD2YAL1_9GENT